jgi:hypothetical protein
VPTEEWFSQIHKRLLAKDPIAPADLAENVLDGLINKLSSKYYYLNDPDIIVDSVSDALLSYIKNPEQFKPSKRGLLGYLQMAAEGDLKNALSKASRRHKKECVTDDVELTLLGGNISLRKGYDQNETFLSDDEYKLEKLYGTIGTLFKDPKDLQMAELILKGERFTASFAKVLGLEKESITVQKCEVKRNKDRIKKRIERYLKGIHEK